MTTVGLVIVGAFALVPLLGLARTVRRRRRRSQPLPLRQFAHPTDTALIPRVALPVPPPRSPA